MPTERIAYFEISAELIMNALGMNDVQLVDIMPDKEGFIYNGHNTYLFLVRHESLDEVQEGDRVPQISPKFTTIVDYEKIPSTWIKVDLKG